MLSNKSFCENFQLSLQNNWAPDRHNQTLARATRSPVQLQNFASKLAINDHFWRAVAHEEIFKNLKTTVHDNNLNYCVIPLSYLSLSSLRLDTILALCPPFFNPKSLMSASERYIRFWKMYFIHYSIEFAPKNSFYLQELTRLSNTYKMKTVGIQIPTVHQSFDHFETFFSNL